MIPRPICVGCAVEMKVLANGVVVNDQPLEGQPATYWEGDEYQCPACGHRIVTGFGKEHDNTVGGSLQFARG